MLYLAYGSNLNRAQMMRRCPSAKAIDKIELTDAKLVFRHVLDIELCPGHSVPCVAWEISDQDIATLDAYEGVAGGVYRKEYVTIETGRCAGKPALLYIMNSDGICPPSAQYYSRVKQGYEDFKMDLAPLKAALKHSWTKKEHSPETKRRSRGAPLLHYKKRKQKHMKATLPLETELRRQDAMRGGTQSSTPQGGSNGKRMNLSDWLAEQKYRGGY